MKTKEFTSEELLFLKSLNAPFKIQAFLDSLHYNKKRRISLGEVLRLKKADCLEAAALACYVFRLNGFETYMVDLSSVDDEDHVICIYHQGGYLGSVAQSKFLGLKAKSPVYQSHRELAMSYFDHYFNFKGQLDLRKTSIPIHLPKKDGPWLFSKKFMHQLERKFNEVKHLILVPNHIKLPRVSPEAFKREILKLPEGAKIGKEYQKVARHIKKI